MNKSNVEKRLKLRVDTQTCYRRGHAETRESHDASVTLPSFV